MHLATLALLAGQAAALQWLNYDALKKFPSHKPPAIHQPKTCTQVNAVVPFTYWTCNLNGQTKVWDCPGSGMSLQPAGSGLSVNTDVDAVPVQFTCTDNTQAIFFCPTYAKASMDMTHVCPKGITSALVGRIRPTPRQRTGPSRG
ncbi:hypothetical protein E4U42_005367 [Claviceps africana]|uniref:Uncharacterized protein n=1 Tax=Claviceps africana TaxID=83212 RepID=A0A8K0NK45_9HYPO|nr:hypothetical protein E4U42_005367 [Claviceps africana]